MAWKWYEITSYKASAGGTNYYGGVQLLGSGFYANIKFHKSGPLPSAVAPTAPPPSEGVAIQYFFGHMDYNQMQMFVDLLRNEKPVRFGWYDGDPNLFHLMTGPEPVGEGDGILAGNNMQRAMEQKVTPGT